MKKTIILTILCFVFLAGVVQAGDIEVGGSYIHRWMLDSPKFKGPSPFQSVPGNTFVHGNWNFENEGIKSVRTLDYRDREFDKDDASGVRVHVLFPAYNIKGFKLQIGPDVGWNKFKGGKNTIPAIIDVTLINWDGSTVDYLSLRDSRKETYDLNHFQGTVRLQGNLTIFKGLDIFGGLGPTFNYFEGSLEVKESVRLQMSGADITPLLNEMGLSPAYRARADVSKFKMGGCGYLGLAANLYKSISLFVSGRYDYVPEFSKSVGSEKFKGKFSTIEASAGLMLRF